MGGAVRLRRAALIGGGGVGVEASVQLVRVRVRVRVGVSAGEQFDEGGVAEVRLAADGAHLEMGGAGCMH